MAVRLTSIRLDTRLADEAAKVLRVKSRTEAVHVALREIVALNRFKNLTTEGTESTEKTGVWCFVSAVSVTSVVVLFGCGSAALRYAPSTSSPRITVTAWPPSFTRLPTTRTRTTPPRAEAW